MGRTDSHPHQRFGCQAPGWTSVDQVHVDKPPGYAGAASKEIPGYHIDKRKSSTKRCVVYLDEKPARMAEGTQRTPSLGRASDSITSLLPRNGTSRTDVGRGAPNAIDSSIACRRRPSRVPQAKAQVGASSSCHVGLPPHSYVLSVPGSRIRHNSGSSWGYRGSARSLGDFGYTRREVRQEV